MGSRVGREAYIALLMGLFRDNSADYLVRRVGLVVGYKREEEKKSKPIGGMSTHCVAEKIEMY